MIPMVTPSRMAEIDASAPEPVDVLIERAGAGVARAATQIMAGCYGRTVVVLCGPGNNGADGKAAARRLARAGARAIVFDAVGSCAPEVLPAADLYIDAAFGTGLSRPYVPPRRQSPTTPVLAVDIPSGIAGLTGEVLGGPVWQATRTVTFAALKPGLVLGAGPGYAGDVEVADIGLAVSPTDGENCSVMVDDDIDPLPAGTSRTHKWHAAALVVAGSAGMGGAAALACAAAIRTGARIVHLSSPPEAAAEIPTEVVAAWPLKVPPERFVVSAIGPGLGTGSGAASRVAEALALGLPAVIDADGLRLLGSPEVSSILEHRKRAGSIPLVLTPHDAEFEALMGARPGADRIAAARSAAAAYNAVVLLKGGPTVVADPQGRTRIVTSGDARLATAGTGDVLTGMIAGRLAAFGTSNVLACVAAAAHLHGRAASAVPAPRLVASDLIGALSTAT